MKLPRPTVLLSFLCACAAFASAQDSSAPYQLLKTAKVGGAGGFDYVYADADGRRLYIPRGNRVTVFNLDTLQSQGEIANTPSVHGVAVDPQSHRGFSSSKPVAMWDTDTLKLVKTIDVEGNPDGIFFDPSTSHVLVLSHRAPNVTVLDSRDGSIVGTIDLGGAPEQGVSDGRGHYYIDLEDKDAVAVVDAAALKVTGRYDLAGKGGGPAGLAIDAKHHLLFACGRSPATAVVLNADSGAIITTLPIGNGTDGAVFNPATMEAFSSQRDGTLTVIKENSPTDFVVEQTVATKPGAKTLSLDAHTNRLLLITAEMTPPPPPAPGEAPKKGRGRGQMVPDSFSILVVGR